MAITATHLVTNGSSTDGTSYATASIAPGANRLVLAAVVIQKDATLGTISLSGNGLTWVQVNDQTIDAGDARITLFRAMGASPSSGAVTITVTQTALACAWSIAEFSGVDTSGTNGSGAVVQSAVNSGDASTWSVTLAAFADAVNNWAYGAFGATLMTAIAVTPGSGFTELGEHVTTTPAIVAQSERKAGEDTSVDASTSPTSTRQFGGVAVEIKATAAVARSRMVLLGVR